MSDKYKVKILSEKLDYVSPPMDIIRYEIEDEKGKKRPYWMLDRKSSFSVVIPLFPDKTTILVGQYRVPVREFSWEFAMGTVPDATPVVTAEQELKEETGITAKKLTEIGVFYLAPGISSQLGYVFLAEDLTIGEPAPEEDEELSTKRLSIKEVGDMIKNKEIKDGPTIIAWNFLQNNL